MSETPRTVELRITDYLCGGGLFNPELANHDAVRDLLIDARDALTAERERADKARREGWETGMREAAYLIDKGKCVTDAAYEAQRSAIISAIEAKK